MKKHAGFKQERTAPRLTVELPVEVQKKTFSLKEPTVKLLASYTAYLSDHHGKKIEEDRVIEGLITDLARDRSFMKWGKEGGHV